MKPGTLFTYHTVGGHSWSVTEYEAKRKMDFPCETPICVLEILEDNEEEYILKVLVEDFIIKRNFFKNMIRIVK